MRPARLPALPPVLARICDLTYSQLVAVRRRAVVQNDAHASETAAELLLDCCRPVKLPTSPMHWLHVPQGVAVQ